MEENIVTENAGKTPTVATPWRKGSALRRPRQPQSLVDEVQQQQERVPRQQKLQPLPKPLPPTLTPPSGDKRTEHQQSRPLPTQDIGRTIAVVLDRPGGYNDPAPSAEDPLAKDTKIAMGGEDPPDRPLFPSSRDDLSREGMPAEGEREGSNYLGDVLEGQERTKPEGGGRFRLEHEVDEGWTGKGPGEEEMTTAQGEPTVWCSIGSSCQRAITLTSGGGNHLEEFCAFASHP